MSFTMSLTHEGDALGDDILDEGGTILAEFESTDQWSCCLCGGEFDDEAEAEGEDCSEAECSRDHNDDDCTAGFGCEYMHELEHEKAPLSWVNSAIINVKEDDDVIEVGISVADPRGAFVMRMWRTDDGQIMMNVPYPGQPLPHAPLKSINDGSYIVNET